MGRKILRRKPRVSRQSQASRRQASASSHGTMVNRKSVSFSLSQFPFRFPFFLLPAVDCCSWSRGQSRH